ncbi:MAG: biopolymer transporter ExbD [Lentisphaerae bacterium]|jgi:biopolymer transport protein ExbD|nr:biopolymer transporter ExbD [Lentisphaerota bacterium]
MASKSKENPQLDMTPMIDVVFELIIFFVVTLTEAQRKDETIELENGQHGIVLTPDELPPEHMQIDIASVDKSGKKLKTPRISMGDRTLTKEQVYERVKARYDKLKREFPVLIRADFDTPHSAVRDVMDACTKAKIWKISFMAIGEDKTNERKRLKRVRH